MDARSLDKSRARANSPNATPTSTIPTLRTRAIFFSLELDLEDASHDEIRGELQADRESQQDLACRGREEHAHVRGVDAEDQQADACRQSHQHPLAHTALRCE